LGARHGYGVGGVPHIHVTGGAGSWRPRNVEFVLQRWATSMPRKSSKTCSALSSRRHF
jgi:hypothetical protein